MGQWEGKRQKEGAEWGEIQLVRNDGGSLEYESKKKKYVCLK